MAQTPRRASEAIEFALSLPVILFALSGLIDFGWYYWQQAALFESVRFGARIGAVTEQDDGPLARAELAVAQQLAQSGVPFTPTLSTVFLTDPTGDQLIQVDATGTYVGLWNLVLAPYELHARVAMRMEEQPEP